MIGDLLSFMCFLGLGFEDSIPDAKTIWLFRELLAEAKHRQAVRAVRPSAGR
jgi:IS5 family transposase